MHTVVTVTGKSPRWTEWPHSLPKSASRIGSHRRLALTPEPASTWPLASQTFGCMECRWIFYCLTTSCQLRKILYCRIVNAVPTHQDTFRPVQKLMIANIPSREPQLRPHGGRL